MPLVGLNSCERIRPERLRNPIQRLVWGPGTQFLVGQVGLPEDEGSNPRMALRRYTNIILLLIHARNSAEISRDICEIFAEVFLCNYYHRLFHIRAYGFSLVCERIVKYVKR